MKKLLLLAFFVISNHVFYGQIEELVWEDNFNKTEIDLNNWNIETGTGVNGDFGTGQIDRATDRPENLRIESNVPGADDGCLVITTQKEFYIDRHYTSARINTAGKGSWGPGHRIVSRAYPRDVKYMGQGFAFWMMPDEIPDGWDYIMWPQGGEVDIMEYVGSIPYNNLGSVHYAWFWENNEWQSWNHGHKGAYYNYETKEVPIPSDPGYGNYPPPPDNPNAGSYAFHEYGIDWYSDRMEFFVDNNVYHIHYLNDGGGFQQDGEDGFMIQNIASKRIGVSEYSNHFHEWYPFEHRMYVILSAGVGGSNYTYGGSIVPEAEFPCSVFIDWVKVYKIQNPSSINKDSLSKPFKIYPNPTDEYLNIELDNLKDYNITIYNISGKEMIKNINESLIDISMLEKGIYLISVKNDNLSISKRFVVN
ncbi:MAG: hypothetical protein C0598_01165 [Marinilabiliales bacterium]|nr:MAG: hypothetical protein C0598_01165 [Marinilabiliales bacterium]